MHDLNPGGEHPGPSQTISDGTWYSRCSRLLVGQRGGFQALVWAAVVNLILFALLLVFATPIYETNDDLMMQMIASGFYTGHPDSHLVFTNILIGHTLRFLYGIWAGCNWYLIYLLAVHYIALTAIAFLVVSRRGGWLFTLLYLGFFLIVEIHILLRLQFTTTAFLAGTAGLLLVVDGLQPGLLAYWPKVMAGLAFWGLMCLIREPVALLLAIVACPFFVERLGLAEWRRLLVAGLAFAGIFLVLHAIDHWAYQRDPAWSEYSEYNRMRGEIQVTDLAGYLPQADSTVGWSHNDGWMFSEFYFPDSKVYGGVARMSLLLDRLKMLARDEPASWWRFSAGSFDLPKVFGHQAGTLMKVAILNGIWCLAAAGAFRRRCLATLLISYGLFVILGFYLQTTVRLPERISYNMALFINTICLYWAVGFRDLPVRSARSGPLSIFLARFQGTKVWAWMALRAVPIWTAWRPRLIRYHAAMLFVLVPIWALLYFSGLSGLAWNLWMENASGRKLEHISHRILEPIRMLPPAQKQPLLIAMPLDSVLEQCLFFYPSVEKVPFSMVPYGWITHSPLFNQILERNHLDPYSLSLVDRPGVFFLMETKWLQPLRIFYREHYNLNVRFDMVLNTDEMPQFADCRLYLYQAHTVGDGASQGTAL